MLLSVAWEKFARENYFRRSQHPLRNKGRVGTFRNLLSSFCSSTRLDRIHEIYPATPHPLAVASACLSPALELSTCFSDAPADRSLKGSAVSPGVDPSFALSKHGPCLVGGTITFDDDSFTTKIDCTAKLASSHVLVV